MTFKCLKVFLSFFFKVVERCLKLFCSLRITLQFVKLYEHNKMLFNTILSFHSFAFSLSLTLNINVELNNNNNNNIQ